MPETIANCIYIGKNFVKHSEYISNWTNVEVSPLFSTAPPCNDTVLTINISTYKRISYSQDALKSCYLLAFCNHLTIFLKCSYYLNL